MRNNGELATRWAAQAAFGLASLALGAGISGTCALGPRIMPTGEFSLFSAAQAAAMHQFGGRGEACEPQGNGTPHEKASNRPVDPLDPEPFQRTAPNALIPTLFAALKTRFDSGRACDDLTASHDGPAREMLG